MLTPAEELGLSGLSLASRVRKAFFGIPDGRLKELAACIAEESRQRHVLYSRAGEKEIVHIMPMPITVLADQLSYIHYVCLTLQNALKRLPDLYFADDEVRAILQLPTGEEDWLRECWQPSQRENNALFSRLDAMVDFISPMWKDSLKFVEPNLGGIGGLHMVPTAERILSDVVLPVLRERDAGLHLERGRDIRELLMQEILDHLQTLDRPGSNICFVEPKYAGYGPEDQEDLARYFHDMYGTRIMHADPTELTLDGEEVLYQGERVDLAYRDYSVYDLLELGRHGADIEPMRALCRQNRVMSSMTAELDQKSCWEVFTDARFAKYFSGDERQVFRRHILWTRIVSDRKTVSPVGQTVDLLTFARNEQEHLVLKPNRSYGGDRVAIGHLVSRDEWQRELDNALADPARWVIQELASIPVSEFPVIDAEGAVHFEPFYVVMGFAATKYGLATLGRASQKQVVNVALRGGLVGVFQGRAKTRLHGPLGSASQ